MARNSNIGGASIGKSSAGSIQRLPDDVVAQLKSSIAVVSLSGVVIELLKNALDAGATKVEGTVDFGRGACTIEDDGFGIAPFEFREEGGIGKPYYTSKYYSDEPHLGRNGTFLASLATVSLLTVTSHHHEHRSHNSITFHHSKMVARELPAPARHDIKFEKHGTRVTVRNLFGNLPVRVKQRAVAVEHTVEEERLFDGLKRDVISLLLSWRQPVSIRIRDAQHKTVFNFSQVPSASRAARDTPGSRGRPDELQHLLNTLTQAGWISVHEWPSWVPASASTSNLSIKGAISLDPAPTKRLQFVSLGIEPVSAERGHNELYDEVNRLFSLSSFGTVEEDVDVNEDEKIRRTNDKRFKSDGYTHHQVKGRKGVDRYPMLHLRVCLKSGLRSHTSEAQFLDQETNIQAVIELLQAMITQWLSVHHFRPRQQPARRARPATASTSATDEEGRQECAERATPSQLGANTVVDKALRYRSANADSGKRKRSTGATAQHSNRQDTVLADWTRIKSGKPEFYNNLWAPRKRGDLSKDEQPPSTGFTNTETTLQSPPASHDVGTFRMAPVLPGSLSNPPLPGTINTEVAASDGMDQLVHLGNEDEMLTWTNPVNKQTYRLNARTGCVVPDVVSRPNSESSSTLQPTRQRADKILRLPKRAKTADDCSNPWLNGLLRTWNNPIFKPTEQCIPEVNLDNHESKNTRQTHMSHFHCSGLDINKAFNNSLTSSSSKLSKEGLLHARVIAQLDKKFILIKMPNSAHPAISDEGEVLVLIDQHAADERIRVETLFAELCAPLPDSETQYKSRLGHSPKVAFSVLEKPLQFSISSQESKLFTTHAAAFAAWGILFDISNSKSSEKPSGKDAAVLSITTLPQSISERCKADPKLPISFLRSTVWKYADTPPPQNHSLSSSSPSDSLPQSVASGPSEATPIWLTRLSSCPQGLVDLVNSRACRSAIMFNDELSNAECEDLVQRLAKCVFPFMCAHGRPSMVPLVGLGSEAGVLGLGIEREESVGRSGFVDVWKQWRKDKA